MNTEETEKEIAAQLRDGIDRIPAEVTPGLASRAYRRDRSRRAVKRAALGSIAVAGAAAVAVAFVVTATPASVHTTTASGTPAVKTSTSKSGAATPTAAAQGNPVLMDLAASISASQVALPGNATLQIRNRSVSSDKPGDNGYDLYTDNGTYYWGNDKSELEQSIASGKDVAGGEFQRDVAVALFAVKGDLATARSRMAVANLDPSITPAEEKAQAQQAEKMFKAKGIKLPKVTPERTAESTDSNIYMNATDALIAAPDNPQVRAGVLRVLASLPNIKVANTTTAGQPTLSVTDSWAAFGDSETLVINASTGLVISMTDTGDGPTVTTYYHASRVTLADVAAGKF